MRSEGWVRESSDGEEGGEQGESVGGGEGEGEGEGEVSPALLKTNLLVSFLTSWVPRKEVNAVLPLALDLTEALARSGLWSWGGEAMRQWGKDGGEWFFFFWVWFGGIYFERKPCNQWEISMKY